MKGIYDERLGSQNGAITIQPHRRTRIDLSSVAVAQWTIIMTRVGYFYLVGLYKTLVPAT